MRLRLLTIIGLLLLMSCAIVFVACGGGGSSPTTTTAKVNLTISDPPTCAGPSGAYTHVYVTIRDVQIHTSASAGPTDAGWVDLTPDLKNAPKQVDLLGIANNQCFLASLGSQTEIPAGSYQQIRVFLTDSTTNVANNQCGNSANCVVLTADGSTHTLSLSSESQTGIKIPSGQLAGGNFTVGAGQVKDLNIDFDACASIIAKAGNQYRLKPVLHAGEVNLTSTSVTGKLVDSVSGQAISGGKAIVALEQKDANGIDRVIMQITPDANGNFVLCPVPAGTYDVVAVAVSGTGVQYAATITTGVQPGTALGNVPLVATSGTNTSAASITGQITTAGGTSGAPADLSVYAMQQVTIGGNPAQVIIPLAQQSSSVAAVSTATGGTCPANTACVNYTLAVPAAWPNIGTFAAAGTSYTQSTTTPVSYSVGAQAFQPASSGTAFCSPSELKVSTTSTGGSLDVTAGASVTAQTMAFTGCQ